MKQALLSICIAVMVSGLSFQLDAADLVNYKWQRVTDLSGLWKFEIGDNSAWADPEFNDERWESIYVPSSWEDEGFPGYDGYAWYRTDFFIGSQYASSHLALFLGYIDDADEVYLNGHLINFEGGMPPDVHTAYHIQRTYYMPNQFINFSGRNVLAVRVYDNYQTGGITRGDIGIYMAKPQIDLEIPLDGLWKFRTGDNPQWKEPYFNDSQWDSITVPGLWEAQGYDDYDGIAWYRKSVFVPESFRDSKLVLMLGKIDDFDESYINGHRIGRKGIIKGNPGFNALGDHYLEMRAYFIPSTYLNFGAENQIAVRVYDGFIKGGIYEGPIGFVTRESYREWWSEVSSRTEKIKHFFELLFD